MSVFFHAPEVDNYQGALARLNDRIVELDDQPYVPAADLAIARRILASLPTAAKADSYAMIYQGNPTTAEAVVKAAIGFGLVEATDVATAALAKLNTAAKRGEDKWFAAAPADHVTVITEPPAPGSAAVVVAPASSSKTMWILAALAAAAAVYVWRSK